MAAKFLVLISIGIFIIKDYAYTQGLEYKKTDTTVAAGKEYRVGGFRKILLGRHYRKEWVTPVTVKIFDIDTVMGGLTPVKLGGSRQTTNLRMTDKLGREYVIRSVNKNPWKSLPKDLQNTIAADIIQDQTSAEHPYASLVLPNLSRAAGIYYTNPKLYFIPYDPGFGEYAKTFSGMLVYFEERPNEDMSHMASSGNSKNVIGTEKLFEKLYEDHDNQVDEKLFLKTRLFDMWIGDWGRHEDQWRWAEFKSDTGNLYRPIPRDRDHTFFKFDGIIPGFVNKKSFLPQFTNFDYKFKNLYGLNRSATPLDREFLTELTKEQWTEVAKELQNSLTDSVIENAFKKMPEQIFQLHGEEIIKKLKSRRTILPKAAQKYYKQLSKNVDIVGSDKEEYFIVNRLDEVRTEVIVLKNKNHQDTLFHRIFFDKETKEIRIYGMGGTDEYHLRGKTGDAIKVRIIGGEGEDKFYDSSFVKGLTKKTVYYDTKSGNIFQESKETNDERSDKTADSVNLYKRNKIDYNYTSIIPSAEYNPDDGIFIGLGVVRKRFGFRKVPYASTQSARLNFATATSSISFRYDADFKDALGKWSLRIENRIWGPRFAFNYFGFGNETVQKDTTIDYYRVRADRFFLEPTFYKNYNPNLEVGFGFHYEYFNLIRTPGRFISEPGAINDSLGYGPNNYVGAFGFIDYSNLDHKIGPKKGMHWFAEAGVYDRLENNMPYANLNSSISFFYTPKLPFRVTLATRIGGATNFGDFQFYRANTLSGPINLRGHRKNRFYGRSSFYHNNDARFYLGNVNFQVFIIKLGLLGFFDYGRVWADGEKSSKLHASFGPGAFIQILDRMVLQATYGFSEDASYLNVQAEFLF